MQSTTAADGTRTGRAGDIVAAEVANSSIPSWNKGRPRIVQLNLTHFHWLSQQQLNGGVD